MMGLRNVRLEWAIAAVFSTFLSGCLGGASGGASGWRSSGTVAGGFPTRDAVEELVEADPPQNIPELQNRVSAEWTVDAERADETKEVERSPWTELVDQAARERQGIVQSAGMQCAAREAARFYLHHGGVPDERLTRFMTARCGETTPTPAVYYFSGDVPDSIREEDLFAKWSKDALSAIREAVGQRPGRVGAWLERKSGKAAFALVFGENSATLEPALHDAAAGMVTLRGKLRTNANVVVGYINQGAYGVKACAVDPTVRLPKFELKCPMAGDDKSTWVDILAGNKERPLMDLVATTLVRAPDEAAATYIPSKLDGVEVKDEQEFRNRVIEHVNQVRKEAKLRPLLLADQQSISNQRLASHFVHASRTGDEDRLDMITLGIVAGWNVQGIIQNAGFCANWMGGVRRASDWVAASLERPFARNTLLDPDARSIAIGPLLMKSGMGALISTYRFFEDKELPHAREQVLDHLRKARARHGAKGKVKLVKVASLDSQVPSVRAGKQTSDEALGVAVESAVYELQRGVAGFYVETSTIDDIEWPKELLEQDHLEVALAVTFTRPEGAAWGRYVVMVVTFPNSGRSA